MALLTDAQQKIFADAVARRKAFAELHKSNRDDAETLEKELKGVRVRKSNATFEITRISSDYSGGFRAKGYRIVKSGARGTQQWDIGALYPACFAE